MYIFLPDNTSSSSLLLSRSGDPLPVIFLRAIPEPLGTYLVAVRTYCCMKHTGGHSAGNYITRSMTSRGLQGGVMLIVFFSITITGYYYTNLRLRRRGIFGTLQKHRYHQNKIPRTVRGVGTAATATDSGESIHCIQKFCLTANYRK
jgi:hypothetical protein